MVSPGDIVVYRHHVCKVAAVREAVDTATAELGKSLLRAVVLPRPEPEVTQALAGVAKPNPAPAGE